MSVVYLFGLKFLLHKYTIDMIKVWANYLVDLLCQWQKTNIYIYKDYNHTLPVNDVAMFVQHGVYK
jgi:hypothetical protein